MAFVVLILLLTALTESAPDIDACGNKLIYRQPSISKDSTLQTLLLAGFRAEEPIGVNSYSSRRGGFTPDGNNRQCIAVAYNIECGENTTTICDQCNSSSTMLGESDSRMYLWTTFNGTSVTGNLLLKLNALDLRVFGFELCDIYNNQVTINITLESPKPVSQGCYDLNAALIEFTTLLPGLSSELGSEKSDDKAPTPTGFAIRWCEEDYLTNHGDKDLKTFSIILVFTSKFFIIMFYYEIYHQLRDRSIHRKTHDWYYIYWSAQLLVIVGMGLLIDFARHHQKNRIAFQIFYVSLIVDVGLTFFVVITLILIDNQCCKGHHRSEQDPETFKTENAHDTHAASGSISGTTEAEIEPNNTNENSTSDPKSKTTGSGASSKDGTSDPKSKTAGSGASSKDGTSDTTGALVRKDVASDSPVSKTVHPATSSITLEGQVETENAHYTHAASGSISGTTEAEVEPNNTNENSTSDPKSKTTGSGASSKDGTSDPKSKTAGSGASSKDGTSDTTGALVRKDVASDSPVSKTVHPTTSSITLEIQVETASVTNSTLVTLSRRGEAINIEEDIDLIAPPLGCICACLYQFCNWNEPSHVPNEKTSLIHKEDTKRKCSLWRMCQSLWKIFLNGISLFTFLAFLSYLTQAVPSIAISYYLSPTASLIRLGFFELVIIVMLGEGAYLLYLLDKFWWLIHVHCTGSIPEEILEEDNKNEHKDKQCHCKSKADASNSSDFEADDTGKGSNTSGKKVKYIDRYLVDGKSPELIPLPFVRKSRCSLSYKKFHWLFVTTLLQIVAFGFVLYVSWRLLHFILTMIVEQTANGNNKFNDILAILPTIAINGWLLFKKGDVLHILKDAVGEVIKSSMEHREHLKHLKHQ